MSKKVKVTQVKSLINQSAKVRGTIQALKLRIGHSREIELDSIRKGMLNKVSHLVKVEDVK